MIDRTSSAVRPLMALAAAVMVAIVLAGCAIGSAKLLISEDEAITPLPAKFTLFDYSSEGERRERAETAFGVELAGNVYSAQIAGIPSELDFRFAPIEGTQDSYLIAIEMEDAFLYGIARYSSAVLEVKVFLPPDDARRLITEEIAEPGGDNGAIISTRPALDRAIGMALRGEIVLYDLPFFLSENPEIQPPPALVRQNGALVPAQ